MPEYIVSYEVIENGQVVLEGNGVVFSHSIHQSAIIDEIKKDLKDLDRPLKGNQTIKITSMLPTR